MVDFVQGGLKASPTCVASPLDLDIEDRHHAHLYSVQHDSPALFTQAGALGPGSSSITTGNDQRNVLW